MSQKEQSSEDSCPGPELHKLKEQLVMEILLAYRSTAAIYGQAKSSDLKQEMDFIRYGLERMLTHFLPLTEARAKELEEYRAPFRK